MTAASTEFRTTSWPHVLYRSEPPSEALYLEPMIEVVRVNSGRRPHILKTRGTELFKLGEAHRLPCLSCSNTAPDFAAFLPRTFQHQTSEDATSNRESSIGTHEMACGSTRKYLDPRIPYPARSVLPVFM